MQKKQGLLAALVGVLAILLLAYYVASPWVMLARFKADAQARNTAKMENYVDFPAVRASIRQQLQARVQAKIGGDPHTPLAAIGMALANTVIEPVVQVAASPQGIVAMMHGENPLPGLDKLGIVVPQPMPLLQPQTWQLLPPEAPAAMHKMQHTPTPALQRKPWRLAYQGLNHAVVRAVPFEKGEPYLVMQRQGLVDWKVVDVQLGAF